MSDVDPRKNRVRLNLEISQAIRDRLEDLQAETGAASLTEVIRSALSAYEMLVRHRKAKGKIILMDDVGLEVELEILL